MFMEDMRAMGVSGSGTHVEIRSVPVIVPDGDNSLPSVPAGTGGPKSKSKTMFSYYSNKVYKLHTSSITKAMLMQITLAEK